ncbi:uncharacterized protein METZ01_LOCUS291595, partial [marine metagenome]
MLTIPDRCRAVDSDLMWLNFVVDRATGNILSMGL